MVFHKTVFYRIEPLIKALIPTLQIFISVKYVRLQATQYLSVCQILNCEISHAFQNLPCTEVAC